MDFIIIEKPNGIFDGIAKGKYRFNDKWVLLKCFQENYTENELIKKAIIKILGNNGYIVNREYQFIMKSILKELNLESSKNN